MNYFDTNLTKKDIFKRPEPQDTTLLGLPRGEVGVLIAPGATGKSYFTLNILLASCGFTKNHLVNKNIKILYISLEDQLLDIQRRLHNYHLSLWLTKDTIESTDADFEIICYKGADRLVAKGLPQSENKLWQSMVKKIKDSSPDLIIIDTLIKAHDGYEENSNPDMSKVLSYFNELALENDCSVLLLHHTNKGAINKDAQSSQSHSRGASSIVDNSRWVISLKKDAEDDTIILCEGLKTNFTVLPAVAYQKDNSGAILLEDNENHAA